MTNFDFPASPSEGQLFTPSGGPQYVYRSPAWRVSGKVDSIVSPTPPTATKPGQLWFNSSTGNTYIWYDDGDSAQWVQINVGETSLPVTSGVGSPEGVVWGSIGALYTRTDGGVGTTFYVKETDGTSYTGWAAK